MGRATGTVLLVLTPLVLTRLAAGSGGVLSGLLIILVFVVTVKVLLFARGRAGQGVARSKFRVLADDATRGELHAVRVRVGEPVRMRYLPRGGKPGELDVTQFHWLASRTANVRSGAAAPPRSWAGRPCASAVRKAGSAGRSGGS
ncbi:hypothetical protein ABZV67_05915 [Streptomyces sp. NPDC005065]|uniref:hypothetical protein n=1 Tax=unclassified Streptomyces TaxID=2593676 RepID=UPI0033A4893A